MKNTPNHKACLTHDSFTAGCFGCDKVRAARAKRARKQERDMLTSISASELKRQDEQAATRAIIRHKREEQSRRERLMHLAAKAGL